MAKRPKHRFHTNPNYNIKPLSPAAVERLLYGEPLPDKHTRERLQQARKENEMPDIKTALESALQNAKEVTASTKALTATITKWAEDDKPLNQTNLKEKQMYTHTQFAKQPDGKVRFVETIGVAKAVFDLVRKNPGLPRKDARNTLMAQGYKKGSVDSLLSQNVRAGIFRQDDSGQLYPVYMEYRPVPNLHTIKKATRKPKKVVAKPAKTITLIPHPATVKAQPKAQPKAEAGIAALKVDTGVLGVPVFDPKELLNTLSVMQASALYQELKKIFGG